MRKLSLSILAAGIALIPAAALAQAAHPGPPRPPAGHGRHGGGMAGMPAHGPNMRMHHRGGRFMHPGRNFRHHRMNRGFVIHPFWFGSQFHINNWQMYGFADPGADGRWVRYYDDAYLIGRDGRVRDTRYGMDWDRYGEEWDMEDGIPAYRGSRDHRPGDEDYEWAESQSGGHHGEGDQGEGDQGEGHHGGQQVMHGGSGYGHGAAYGGYYGYGFYAYPIVIETVTTTGCGCSYEVVEEVVVRQRHRRHRPAPRPRPPRRQPPGERG